MFLRNLNRWRTTVGYRLTLWYSGVFILSAIGLFVLIYVLVSTTLKREDERFIEKYIIEYAGWYKTGGLKEVIREVSEEKKVEGADPFFVRVANARNQTLYSSLPVNWSGFDVYRLENINEPSGWIHLNSRRGSEILDMFSHQLPDGGVLQVGKSSEDRDELLFNFRRPFAAIIIPMLFVGFSGGAFLAHRALKPLQQLSATIEDIVQTGRLKTQVFVRPQGNELDKLLLLFNKMVGNNYRLIQGMRDTMDNVAHDLRTPMTRLRGTAETALQSTDIHICHNALADCLEECDKVITMLKTIMDIAEAESGTLRLKIENIILRDILEDVVDLYQYVADEKGVVVSFALPETLTLPADYSRLRQVLANLLDNAVKYTPSGGQVKIIAYETDNYVCLNVEDTGLGISTEDLPRIWDRLFRGDKSRSHPGLGLGLSFVKAIVEAHNGIVSVTSHSGTGSCFSLSFPKGLASPEPNLTH